MDAAIMDGKRWKLVLKPGGAQRCVPDRTLPPRYWAINGNHVFGGKRRQ